MITIGAVPIVEAIRNVLRFIGDRPATMLMVSITTGSARVTAESLSGDIVLVRQPRPSR